MDSIIEWFGNPDWGLGLPFPEIMAWAAALTEAGGAVLLLIGFAVRWISIPMMVTMVVAAVTVHLPNGWLAIAEGSGPFATERTMGAVERLDRAKEILQTHGNYDWLTQNGSFVVLNNGIEFAATYFIMLLVLFFIGAGRFFSMDYWIRRAFMR
jgi:putative oxidoreductase